VPKILDRKAEIPAIFYTVSSRDFVPWSCSEQLVSSVIQLNFIIDLPAASSHEINSYSYNAILSSPEEKGMPLDL
jgi:hypothetical protein